MLPGSDTNVHIRLKTEKGRGMKGLGKRTAMGNTRRSRALGRARRNDGRGG